jgi:hypothetical protein
MKFPLKKLNESTASPVNAHDSAILPLLRISPAGLPGESKRERKGILTIMHENPNARERNSILADSKWGDVAQRHS